MKNGKTLTEPFLFHEPLKRKNPLSFMKSALAVAANFWARYILSVKFYRVAVRSLEDEIKVMPALIDTVCRQIGDMDTAIMQGKISERKIETFRRRVEKGCTGFVALNDGNMTGFGVSAAGFDTNRGMTIKAGPGDGVIVEIYTLPHYRGNKIQTYLTGQLLRHLKTKGCKRALVAYESDNEHSRRVFINNRFVESSRVMVINLIGLRFRMSSKMRKDGTGQ
ncbi:MAG: N-acetyltransferase family protein [Bacteroidota bacterium]